MTDKIYYNKIYLLNVVSQEREREREGIEEIKGETDREEEERKTRERL